MTEWCLGFTLRRIAIWFNSRASHRVRIKMDKDIFTETCICWWSKDNLYGFIPSVDCPVHGKEVSKYSYEGYEKLKAGLKKIKKYSP